MRATSAGIDGGAMNGVGIQARSGFDARPGLRARGDAARGEDRVLSARVHEFRRTLGYWRASKLGIASAAESARTAYWTERGVHCYECRDGSQAHDGDARPDEERWPASRNFGGEARRAARSGVIERFRPIGARV